MKRGVCLKLVENDGSFLRRLLQPIELSAYCWKVDSDESYDENDVSLLPLEELIKGDAFEYALIGGFAFYVYFLDLKAFTNPQEVEEIDTYEEFIRSRCEIMIFITDGGYCEVYAKDQVLLEQLYKKAHETRCEEIEYVTDGNDARTRMSVW